MPKNAINIKQKKEKWQQEKKDTKKSFRKETCEEVSSAFVYGAITKNIEKWKTSNENLAVKMNKKKGLKIEFIAKKLVCYIKKDSPSNIKKMI